MLEAWIGGADLAPKPVPWSFSGQGKHWGVSVQWEVGVTLMWVPTEDVIAWPEAFHWTLPVGEAPVPVPSTAIPAAASCCCCCSVAAAMRALVSCLCLWTSWSSSEGLLLPSGDENTGSQVFVLGMVVALGLASAGEAS